MKLEINRIHEMYEVKRALKINLSIKNNIIEALEQYEDELIGNNTSYNIVNALGKTIASLKRDTRTNLELIRKINSELYGNKED